MEVETSLSTRLMTRDEFPESLKAFMRHNKIPADAYDLKSLSRFVRYTLFTENTETPFWFTE